MQHVGRHTRRQELKKKSTSKGLKLSIKSKKITCVYH